jgi:hypothetical protein
MTAARDRFDGVHHHPAGVRCVACIVAGIDVTPTDIQAGRIKRADVQPREVAA